MPTDRRNPHQPFDPTLIADFLAGRTVLSARLMPHGRSNTNYRLSLSDGSTCLLRLRSGGDAGREAYVMGLVRDLVPVPEEVYRGDTWSVFTFLEGDLLQNVPERVDKAAEALTRISSIKFQAAGWIGGDGSVSPFEFGNLEGYFSMILQDIQVQHWLEPATIELIMGILVREAHKFEDLSGEGRLVHGDFSLTNILIYQAEVSGVLDWEYAHSGTPYMDIGNLLRHAPEEYHEKVKAGLEAGRMNLPVDWKERAELVDLSSHLEFLTSTRSDEFKRQCVAQIERFILRFGG